MDSKVLDIFLGGGIKLFAVFMLYAVFLWLDALGTKLLPSFVVHLRHKLTACSSGRIRHLFAPSFRDVGDGLPAR